MNKGHKVSRIASIKSPQYFLECTWNGSYGKRDLQKYLRLWTIKQKDYSGLFCRHNVIIWAFKNRQLSQTGMTKMLQKQKSERFKAWDSTAIDKLKMQRAEWQRRRGVKLLRMAFLAYGQWKLGTSVLQPKETEFCQEPEWVWKLTLPKGL